MYIHMFHYIISKSFPYIIFLITAFVQCQYKSYCAPASCVPVPGKKFFKMENNEQNELSECTLYKMFCFSGKHLKNVKLSFKNIFMKLYFALLALKVSVKPQPD